MHLLESVVKTHSCISLKNKVCLPLLLLTTTVQRSQCVSDPHVLQYLKASTRSVAKRGDAE